MKFEDMQGIYIDVPEPNVIRTTEVKYLGCRKIFGHTVYSIDCSSQHIKHLTDAEKNKLIHDLEARNEITP
jgi:hypothetical protein